MPIVHDSIMVNNTNTDTYATHEAKYGKGGYRTVANIAERDAITYERCEEGMLVVVISDNTDGGNTNVYMLKTNDRTPGNRVWEKLNLNGTGTGTIDPALLDAKLDKSVYDADKPTFALKTELDSKLDEATYNNDKANLDTRFDEKLDKSAYDTEKATFATKTELGDKANSADVYTKAETDQKIADAVTGGTVDLSNYATKTELGAKLDTATYEAEKADFATKTELGNKLDASTYNADKPTFALKAEVGDLTALDTTSKDTLVNAINEVRGNLNPYDDTQIKADLATAQQEIDALELSLADKQDKLSETQLQNIDDIPNKANSADVYTKRESDNNYINKSEKAQPNGVATLNAAGKIIPEQLGLSALNLIGEYNASTNTPALQDGTGNQGDFYIVQGEGTQNFGAGDISFLNGDFVIYIDGVWHKSINSNAVVSVNGKTGAVEITAQDISEIGDVTALNTTAKDTLVNAINEVNTKVDTKTSIDDTQASASTTYSSNKIDEKLDTKQDVLKGGPGQIVGFDEDGNAISTTQLEFASTLASPVTQEDFEPFGTLTYTVSDDGTITSSADFNKAYKYATNTPRISFGAIYSLEFTVSRNVHFIVLEEDLSTGGQLILALGGGNTNPYSPRLGLTGWLQKVENGRSTNVVEYHDTNNAGIQYQFVVGDRIRIVRNQDGTCTLYRTTNANGTLSEWFTTPLEHTNIFPYKSLGLAFGITEQEFLNNTSFSVRDNKVANQVKIQHTHNPDIEFLRDEISKKGDANKVYDKFVVVAVAGQSNAVGYDESPVTNLNTKSIDEARIKQLGFYGDDNLKLIPLGWCAQNMQDMRQHNRRGTATAGTKGVHLPLANELLPHIPEDYGILILPIAFGGTGFNTGNVGNYDASLMKPTDTGSNAGQGTIILKWGVDTAYYQTLRDRIKHALGLNENNRFAGIVWCQGENDQGDAANHKTAFEEMTNRLFTELNDAGYGSRTPKGTFDKDIWYNMETVGWWYYAYNGVVSIWDNYRAWNPKTFIEIPRIADSNVLNGTGSTSQTRQSHFGNDAYSKVVAPIVAKALLKGNSFSSVVPSEEILDIPFKDNTGSQKSTENPFGANVEEYREISSNDFTTGAANTTFSVGLGGTITSSETLSGKFTWTSCEPTINFGDVYSIEFEATRNVYWIAVEGDPARKELILIGLGGGASTTTGSVTGQITKISNGGISTIKQASLTSGIHRNFLSGDRIRVIRNRDKSVSFYLMNPGQEFYHWFTYPKLNLLSGDILGLSLGISAAETTGVGAGDVTAAGSVEVQKEEITVTNKYLQLKLEALERRLAALETP